jgi:hypothetical protein
MEVHKAKLRIYATINLNEKEIRKLLQIYFDYFHEKVDIDNLSKEEIAQIISKCGYGALKLYTTSSYYDTDNVFLYFDDEKENRYHPWSNWRS